MVATQEAGLARFRVLDFGKGSWGEVAFPDPVYTATVPGRQEFDTGTFRFRYQSFVTPPSVYDVDMATGTGSS